jgi:hypothetical protein
MILLAQMVQSQYALVEAQKGEFYQNVKSCNSARPCSARAYGSAKFADYVLVA